MPGDPLKKVRRGDKLQFPASAFNAFVDSAKARQESERAMGEQKARGARSVLVFPVKNTSGGDRDRFDVLGIDDLIFDSAENLDEFKNNPAIVGVTPDEDDHLGRLAILTEPIPSGKIGRGMVLGVTPVRINVVDAAHVYADVEDADATRLISRDEGAAVILWKQDGTGEKWALVKLGGGRSMPIGTGLAQVLYWDHANRAWALTDVPADPGTKDYIYVWDHDLQIVKAVETYPFVCDEA